jgi:lipopolysaccharide/colanic/teichoic acid biosynthesis glycosyltransferase
MELVILKQPRVFPRRLMYQRAKRVIDVALSMLSLPVTLPIMSLCALAIYLDSPGPILFVQERIGRGGRPFRMYKFRTMKPGLNEIQCREYMKAYVRGEIGNGENGGQDGQEVFKPVGTQDIIRVGHILRKTSLDELPQIINVLKGEMSIVGPRPNVPWEVEAYRPWQHERLEVLPGITGLAQVCGRSCIDFVSLVRHDIEYIEKQSLGLDLKILWWTLTAILRGKGAL